MHEVLHAICIATVVSALAVSTAQGRKPRSFDAGMNSQEAYDRFRGNVPRKQKFTKAAVREKHKSQEVEKEIAFEGNRRNPFRIRGVLGSWKAFEQYVFEVCSVGLGLEKAGEYVALKNAYPNAFVEIEETFRGLKSRHGRLSDDELTDIVFEPIAKLINLAVSGEQSWRESREVLPRDIDAEVSHRLKRIVSMLKDEGRYNANLWSALEYVVGPEIKTHLLEMSTRKPQGKPKEKPGYRPFHRRVERPQPKKNMATFIQMARAFMAVPDVED